MSRRIFVPLGKADFIESAVSGGLLETLRKVYKDCAYEDHQQNLRMRDEYLKFMKIKGFR